MAWAMAGRGYRRTFGDPRRGSDHQAKRSSQGGEHDGTGAAIGAGAVDGFLRAVEVEVEVEVPGEAEHVEGTPDGVLVGFGDGRRDRRGEAAGDRGEGTGRDH